jgi:hypothetical protein
MVSNTKVLVTDFTTYPLRYDVLVWLLNNVGEPALSITELIHTNNITTWFYDRSVKTGQQTVRIVFIDKAKAMWFKLTWL